MNVDLHPIFTHFCMSELTLPDAALSNIVKQLDRRKRGNLKCKYMLFLVKLRGHPFISKCILSFSRK